MRRVRWRVSIPVLLVLGAGLGTHAGCSEQKPPAPVFVEDRDGNFWLEVEKPALSYEVGTSFELSVRYGHEGYGTGGDPETQSLSATLRGTAVSFVQPLPTWPRMEVVRADDVGHLAYRAETGLRLTCKSADYNQKLAVVLVGTDSYASDNSRTTHTLTVEVTINCVGTGEAVDEESFALGAVELGGNDYFDGQFTVELDGETFYWSPDADAVPPIAVDGQTPAPTPDPTTGFGVMGDVPQKVVVVTRTQLETFCAGYQAELPSGLTTAMLQTCDTLLAGGTSTCTGTDCPQGVIVEACDYVSAVDAAAVLGNPVTYFIEPLENTEDSIRCAYSGDDNGVDWTFTADLSVFRATHSVESVDSRLFRPQTVSSADFVVINDIDGVMTDLLNAGVVQIGTQSYPISRGTADPALGGLTVMARGVGVKVLSFVNDYDIAIQVDIWDNQPTDPVDPAPSRADYESHALELARQVFSAVTNAQSQ